MRKMIIALAALLMTAGMLFAGDYEQVSSGTAALECREGVHTVYFSDGAAYTGPFSSCRPVSGWGTYIFKGTRYSGYFTARGNKVTLIKDGTQIILQVQ